MRLLRSSTFLFGLFLPMMPACSQALFDATTVPELRDGDDVAVSATDPNAIASTYLPIPSGPEQTRVQAVGPVQSSDPVDSEQEGAFDPIGIPFGNFILYPSIGLYSEFTDNVDNASVGDLGRIGSVELEAKVESNWQRHALELEGSVTLQGYETPVRQAQNEEHLDGELTLDLADGTELSLTGDLDRTQEEESSTELAASGGTATYQTQLDVGAVLDHQLGDVALQLRGSVASNQYRGASERNYETYTAGGRVGFRLTDQIMPYVDLEVSRQYHRQVSNRQNGDSLRGAIGIEIADREKLSGEVSVGIQTWRPARAGQKEDAILFADASVTWSPNALWSIRGGISTDLTSTATSASSVATHTASLSTDYAVLRNLTLGLDGSIARAAYNGTNRKDWTLDATLNATYSFSRSVQFIASVGHERRESNEANGYSSNSFRMGLKFQH